ncbi:S-adenosylmethionine tRNA ribosyltransferase [Mesobacillus campisalis]|uniref:S-adenosylmethionine tRNA ribosyltransferase n=1 Tax=Mesobacillus campisalis TaxID=1408103 RepID=A0A0M2SXM5_9BACI|nr:S-adenosylmethionine:tRNA ribosyltransferase-isomerase [Mesobacillus campisalis]KKK37360.1 S-adenosylmethionine tRNA ribosyltransferase [Mesobacillus campisalis]
MTTAQLDFELPPELNASMPPERRGIRRDQVRMMVLDRISGRRIHDSFFRLGNYLKPGDLIVLNSSRTVPALLKGTWKRGKALMDTDVEVRLARRKDDSTWEALVAAAGASVGDTLQFSPGLSGVITGEKASSPIKSILFSQAGTELYNIFYDIGEPITYEYIEKPWKLDYYQTVFASSPGSVEMPSAGRAFSWELLFQLQNMGVSIAFIQLHTGLSYLGEDFDFHPEEHEETYHVPGEVMQKISSTKAAGGRIIAAGTTVVRAIETVGEGGKLSGSTNLYVSRDTRLNITDGILTGFHEPKASHLDMLTAFVSEHHLLCAYQEAVKSRYLWHEFGDMNLIL